MGWFKRKTKEEKAQEAERKAIYEHNENLTRLYTGGICNVIDFYAILCPSKYRFITYDGAIVWNSVEKAVEIKNRKVEEGFPESDLVIVKLTKAGFSRI